MIKLLYPFYLKEIIRQNVKQKSLKNIIVLYLCKIGLLLFYIEVYIYILSG